MKYLKVIEREGVTPIKWKCNGFIIEKYFISNINMYTYGVSSPKDDETCFCYVRSLKEARGFCVTNKVEEMERLWLN